ncbi:PPE family protein [Mycolicibacter minnesotensis]
MEFGALPPEINSGWMYTGPGAAPMMAAAATWHGLALDLGSTATAYQAVVTQMAGELWTGSASAAMVAAVTPYVAWLNTTAELAEQAAAQATAAAAAFETAYAGTVPPPVIVANRAQLMLLVATNVLGQNAPAIAATEAQYGLMWAQDAAAMYGYAGASAAAAQVTPFGTPTTATSPAGLAGVAQVIAAVPTTLQGLSAPLQAGSSAAPGVLSALLDPVGLSSMAGSGGSNLVGVLANMLGIFGSIGAPSPAPAAVPAGAVPAGAVPAGAVSAYTGTGSWPGTAGAWASAGRAGTVGALSVPPAWTAGAAGSSTTTAAAGPTLAAATGRGPSAMPAGLPIGAPAARSSSAAPAPSYGFRPTVTMHPVAAG